MVTNSLAKETQSGGGIPFEDHHKADDLTVTVDSPVPIFALLFNNAGACRRFGTQTRHSQETSQKTQNIMYKTAFS